MVAKKKICTPCQVNAAFGIAFNVCSALPAGTLSCRRLQSDLNKGRITKATALKKIISAAEAHGKTKAVKDIRRVARIINVKV